MPSRGSGLAVAVASTTLSPERTTAEPWACLASFPVSNESCFPPTRSTVTVLTSGFIFYPYCVIRRAVALSDWHRLHGWIGAHAIDPVVMDMDERVPREPGS